MITVAYGCVGARAPFGHKLCIINSMKSLLKTFESILVLSCEASVSLVRTLGGHDFEWCVSVGGLAQDSAFSFLIQEGWADEY